MIGASFYLIGAISAAVMLLATSATASGTGGGIPRGFYSGTDTGVSLAGEVLSDHVSGYQLLAGLDFPLSERFRAGLKLRYGAVLGDFEDGDSEWKPLRGHGSTAGPPASRGEPARALWHNRYRPEFLGYCAGAESLFLGGAPPPRHRQFAELAAPQARSGWGPHGLLPDKSVRGCKVNLAAQLI